MSRTSVLAPLLALVSVPLWAMNFKAEIQPLKLPQLVSTSQPPKVKYTPPGQVDVALMRMCGDGDVARFSKANPDFEFVPTNVKEMDVLIGYWVAPEGASSLPSSTNFYSVGHRKAPVAETKNSVAYDGTFAPVNNSGLAGINGLALLATDIINLNRHAQSAFKPNKGYQIFAGVFTCLNPSDVSELGTGKFAPTPVEVTHSIMNVLPKIAEARALTAPADAGVTNFIANNSKIFVKVSADPDKDTIYSSANYIPVAQAPYQFDFKASDADTLTASADTHLLDIFEKVAKLTYPTLTKTTESEKIDEFKSKLAAESVHGKLSGVTGDELSYCSGLGINTKQDGPQYRWEAFPMNLTCKNLHNDQVLKSAYKALFQPTSLPTEEDFEDMKLALAARYYVGAVMEGVQKAMQNDNKVKLNRVSCFNTSKKMISRLVGSYPLNFAYDSSSKAYRLKVNANNHLHPESLFALVDYKRYFEKDALGLFGQVLKPSEANTFNSDQWSIKVPLQDKSKLPDHAVDSATFNGVPLNILFKIRSIGGSCTPYC